MSLLNVSCMLVLIVAVSTTDSAGAPSRDQGLPIYVHETNAYQSTPSEPLSCPGSAPFATQDCASLPEPVTEDCALFNQRKKLRGKIDRAVITTAQLQLTLPMGSGRHFSVGGKRYLFCLEPHYHEPGGGRKPEGWHKGVTVYDAT